jgi:hypothetical protein
MILVGSVFLGYRVQKQVSDFALLANWFDQPLVQGYFS